MQPLDTHVGGWARFMLFESWGNKYLLAPSGERRITIAADSRCNVICDRCLRNNSKCEEFFISRPVNCIGEYAFASPTLLKIEFLSNNQGNWLWVKAHGFDETPSLTSLTLPACDIHLSAHAFGPDLKSIRFLGLTPPECDPDAFASARSLTKITVDREAVDAYTAVFSKLRPGTQIVPYISPEEKKALNKKLREERLEKQRKEKEARIVDATIRVFLPADQRTEIRWTEKSSTSSVPTVVSQSHPQAIIEVEFAKKTDSKCAYKVDITNLKDWDKLCKKIFGYYWSGANGDAYKWHMHPKAPKIAHIILNNLIDSKGDESTYTLLDFMSGRDKINKGPSRVEYEVATLRNLDGQGLMLEYLIKLDPKDFNVGKLSFFSFKGKNVSKDHELCADLSRQDKVRTRNKANLAEYHKELEEQREINDEKRKIRQQGMPLFVRVIDDWVSPSADKGILDSIPDVEEQSDSDDNIVWFDIIKYDSQFGTLMKVYRVNYDNTLEELNVKA